MSEQQRLEGEDKRWFQSAEFYGHSAGKFTTRSKHPVVHMIINMLSPDNETETIDFIMNEPQLRHLGKLFTQLSNKLRQD